MDKDEMWSIRYSGDRLLYSKSPYTVFRRFFISICLGQKILWLKNSVNVEVEPLPVSRLLRLSGRCRIRISSVDLLGHCTWNIRLPHILDDCSEFFYADCLDGAKSI